jgi:hypothetical protein
MAGQFRPRAVFQLKRDPKHPKGSRLGGVNCNPTAGATLVDFVTCGAKRTTGAAVRELTGDTEGGTFLSVVVSALRRGFDIDLDVNTGSFDRVIKALKAGRAVSLCGSSIATVRTQFKASETFDGNHQWAVTDIRKNAAGELELLVFDPLADGRRRGIATSPMWMPVDIVREFAGKLDLRSPAERKAKRPRRPLGIGRATYGVTEVVSCSPGAAKRPPTVTIHAGASLVNAQAGRKRTVKVPVGRIRELPTTTSDIVGRKRAGETFPTFQVVKGQSVAGSRIWFGDREGERWMHESLFEDALGVAGPQLGAVGEDPAAAQAPDAVDDHGVDDELLEGAEDDVAEEAVDDTTADAADAGPEPGEDAPA